MRKVLIGLAVALGLALVIRIMFYDFNVLSAVDIFGGFAFGMILNELMQKDDEEKP
jgi:hypothetical protein